MRSVCAHEPVLDTICLCSSLLGVRQRHALALAGGWINAAQRISRAKTPTKTTRAERGTRGRSQAAAQHGALHSMGENTATCVPMVSWSLLCSACCSLRTHCASPAPSPLSVLSSSSTTRIAAEMRANSVVAPLHAWAVKVSVALARGRAGGCRWPRDDLCVGLLLGASGDKSPERCLPLLVRPAPRLLQREDARTRAVHPLLKSRPRANEEEMAGSDSEDDAPILGRAKRERTTKSYKIDSGSGSEEDGEEDRPLKHEVKKGAEKKGKAKRAEDESDDGVTDLTGESPKKKAKAPAKTPAKTPAKAEPKVEDGPLEKLGGERHPCPSTSTCDVRARSICGT